MGFECSKYHAKCGALCCNAVPIPKEIYERNRKRLVREVLQEHELSGIDPDTGADQALVLPETENGKCPFLGFDLSCNVYDDRPMVCRRFGDESHAYLRCPYQDREGNPRSRQCARAELRAAERSSRALVNKLRLI